MMLPLAGKETIPLNGGELLFWPAFLDPAESRQLFELIRKQTPWEQSRIVIAGKEIAIPRLNAWYGENGADYSYSGVALKTQPFYPALSALKSRIQEISHCHFNSALVNLYRNHRDSVDWHADDEPELGANPVVASVSLGEPRYFELRRKDNHRNRYKIALTEGSLLVMQGPIQHYWQHRIAKEKNPVGERINLTFRAVKIRKQ